MHGLLASNTHSPSMLNSIVMSGLYTTYASILWVFLISCVKTNRPFVVKDIRPLLTLISLYARMYPIRSRNVLTGTPDFFLSLIYDIGCCLIVYNIFANAFNKKSTLCQQPQLPDLYVFIVSVSAFLSYSLHIVASATGFAGKSLIY